MFKKKKAPSPVYRDLLSRYLGPALQHQRAFGREVVQDQEWFVDFGDGTIRFGERKYPVQFIGTESDVSHTWLWGVENVNGYPEDVLTVVNQFFNPFVLQNVPDLAKTHLRLSGAVNGHFIASIMAAMAKPPFCYYRCPYENGAAFVLVGGVPEQVFAPVGVETAAEIIMNLIQQAELDHWVLAESMLGKNAVSVAEAGGQPAGAPGERSLTGTFADGRALVVSFDGKGRIANLSY
ncbi:MAG: hypothetical protein LBR44_12320 [Clostridiales Family XIII bacterium]|jgi:hypothetical protein|nr:hypothetical protein [Clostridiales Family XIII bacterium]